MVNAQHGTDYRYRRGCRCKRCRADHATGGRSWKRDAYDIPDDDRQQILERIETGADPAEITLETGYTWQKIHGVARHDETWREDLDAALIAGRDPEISHGRYQSYRHHGCRCPECRQARREVEARYQA